MEKKSAVSWVMYVVYGLGRYLGMVGCYWVSCCSFVLEKVLAKVYARLEVIVVALGLQG